MQLSEWTCCFRPEDEDDCDNNHSSGTVHANVEASQKDIQHGKDKGRSTHLIIQFMLILHKVQKWPFWLTVITLSFTRDCCSANTDAKHKAQGQDAGESQSCRRVWMKAKWTFIQSKTGFHLTSPVLITQLQQFPEGNCALSSPFLPPGSMQAADWWERGGLTQGPMWDHSHAVSHSPSIICAWNVWIIPRIHDVSRCSKDNVKENKMKLYWK